MVTDDLSAYKPVVERLGLDHQIRIAHVKKCVRNRLDRIEGLGLDQGEDMEAVAGRRLGAFASGARGSGRRRYSPPPARGVEREVAGAVMPPPAGRS